MLLRALPRRSLAILLLSSAALAGCQSVGIAHRNYPIDGTVQRVDVPVRAHLNDGRTVLYRHGVRVENNVLLGHGVVFGLRLDSIGMVERFPLDSIAAMESIHQTVNVPETLLLTTLGLAAGGLGTAALAVAVFGSCPTFYAAEGSDFVLEAEGFSYSISPLMETRAVDVLGLRANGAGDVLLEVRNEALETHFINHLEIIEARHGSDEIVVPDARGRPLALSGRRHFDRAVDRSGRDVLAVLSTADQQAYATPLAVLDSASEADLTDWIDLVVARPADVDSVALSFRLRNSLLTTILLYDYMLAAQGAQSLTWLGRDIEVIENAVELARWYSARMGLRVAVRHEGDWREVARMPATGPLAWETMAITVPVPANDSLRVRLSFATDEWRIDEVALATGARAVTPRVLPISRVIDASGEERADVARQLHEPDDLYLETRPGTRFTAEFHAGPEPESGARTFLLASQGYYVEWIRASWMRTERDRVARFAPSDRVLLDAMRSWSAARDTFELAFYNSRIPVR